MTNVTTTVMERGKPRFNMVGQKLADTLHEIEETISPGLVGRLRKYAIGRLESAGFEIGGWDCEVYTMDGDVPRSDRYYTVEFTNAKRGMLGVQGIGTRHGHPDIDHGVCVETDHDRMTSRS